jgi:alpha-1,3-rhamnosyl/mannosyltransferase
LVGLLDIPASKVSVVHNGVDLSRWSAEPSADDAARRAASDLGDVPYLLYVGAADWRKNTVGMLSGLSRARRQPGGEELVLAWAGRMGGAWQREISRASAALGLGDAVRLLGYLSDEHLGSLYRGAVAQLFVSRAEGFGYPVIEAMASGCPVIASNCSSTHEIAEGAAISVSPEDHDGIADAALSLLRDEGERTRLREAGLQRARTFSVERMARETYAVYQHLLRS